MKEPRGETGWERLFQLVFVRTSNPVVLLDGERRVADLNEAAVELLGGPRERLLGSSIADSILPAERALSAEEWEQFLQTGEYSGARDLLRGDGSRVRIQFAARLAPVDGDKLAVYVLMNAAEASPPPLPRPVALPLTSREREIVRLIALGRDTGEIAAELHISPETVRSHVRNAMSKLDVHTRAQLVAVVLCAERHIHDESGA